MNKYRNKKVELDGYVFDSLLEARYYSQLKLRLKAQDIHRFDVKPPAIELLPAFEDQDGKVRAITWRPDFIVYCEGRTEYVDVKGFRTKVFDLKWKLLRHKLAQHGGGYVARLITKDMV